MLEFCHHACGHKVTISILYLSHYKVVFIGIKKLACLSTNIVPLKLTYMEYAILELKLLSTAVALYRAFLRCSFAAAVALRLRSVSVRLMTSAAASLKTLDGSVWTAFCHVVGPHPAPSLQRSPAPAHRPCHDPAWLLLICFPPSNLLRMCIQLSARFVVKLPERVTCHVLC